MNLFSFLPQPYLALAEVGVALAVVAAIYGVGHSNGAAGVQAKWDAQTAAAAIERSKKLIRDIDNNTARDATITSRLAQGTQIDSVIAERISHVPQDSQCTRIPRDLGVLVNAAAAGVDPDAGAAGQPDGVAAAAAAPHAGAGQ